MNPSQVQRLKPKHPKHPISQVLISGLASFGLLATFAVHSAESAPARIHAIKVDSFSRTGVKFWKGYSEGSLSTNTLLRGSNNRLSVAGQSSQAGLGFVDRNVKRLSAQNLFTVFALANNRTAYYFYPCTTGGDGTAVIGWLNGSETREGCAAAVSRARIRPNARANFSRDYSIAQDVKPKNLPDKNLLKAQRFSNGMSYCSAVANSGQRWGAVISNSDWDVLSPQDPCAQAVRQCEINAGGSCYVTNLGEQLVAEPIARFTTVLKCNDQLFPQTGEVKFLNQWLLSQAQSNGLNSSACSLHVMSADEILIFPITAQPTVVTATTNNGRHQIVVLAGTVRVVRVVPTESGLAVSTLSAGEQCISADEPLLGSPQNPPMLAALTKPIAQVQLTEACNQGQETRVISNRVGIYQSEPVQGFFSIKNPTTGVGTWSVELTPEIKEYENAVIRQFLPPASRTSPIRVQP
ncbi:MAG: hypothetical protein HC866_22110 [Leptolyngbyaceae cyanobacterium RU_5_1]|nr:hypothetical protein [Leptolyngbyaceae cyanobacterium RU_5_1]